MLLTDFISIMPFLKFLPQENKENKNCYTYEAVSSIFIVKVGYHLKIQKQENVHTAVKSCDRLS